MSWSAGMCRNICAFQRIYAVTRVTFFSPRFGGEFLSTNVRSESPVVIRYKSTFGLPQAKGQLLIKPLKKKSGGQIDDLNFLHARAIFAVEEFELERMRNDLEIGNAFGLELSSLNTEFDPDVIHLTIQLNTEEEPKDIFVFREGSVVFWNFQKEETTNILSYFKRFHKDKLGGETVVGENDFLPYTRSHESQKTLLKNGRVVLSSKGNEGLEKFAISNAMALSVHLGACESLLNNYIETMFPVTDDLRTGKHIKMSRKEVMQKMGQLFTLRHVINLSSDLLDTPDFYWDREELENLYMSTFNYFSITRRTKVINEKINHCIELVDLLSAELSDAHHIRLEMMIIVLIMVEVVFEIIHCFI